MKVPERKFPGNCLEAFSGNGSPRFQMLPAMSLDLKARISKKLSILNSFSFVALLEEKFKRKLL